MRMHGKGGMGGLAACSGSNASKPMARDSHAAAQQLRPFALKRQQHGLRRAISVAHPAYAGSLAGKAAGAAAALVPLPRACCLCGLQRRECLGCTSQQKQHKTCISWVVCFFG